jgi:hypothetical protein
MGNRRLELHEFLCSILETRNVYFQPPESIRMTYPAIVYRLDDIENVYANDGIYLSTRRYSVTIIDEDPDSLVVDKISKLREFKFNRSYYANNMNHYVFEIYY